jgi:hypothetical protein
MRRLLFYGLVALLGWFLFDGPAPLAVAAEPSLSVKEFRRTSLSPGGDEVCTWQLKLQGVRKVTAMLLALSGKQVKTCVTSTGSWTKNNPSKEGDIFLLIKHQTEKELIPSLGFNPGGGEGLSKGDVVKVKGSKVVDTAIRDCPLSSKGEAILFIALIVDKGSGTVSFPGKEPLKTLKDLKTWAKKYPKVTVIVLTVSWLPAE